MKDLRPLTRSLGLIGSVSCFILWLSNETANGQSNEMVLPPLLGQLQQCSILELEGGCSFGSDSGVAVDQESELPFETSRPMGDPMLAKMPGLDFMAYKRPDISSMYREAPGSRHEKIPSFKGQAGKFVNMSPERLDLYWDSEDGTIGQFMGATGPFESSGTSSFANHVFHFVRPSTQEIVCTFKVKQNVSVYYCDPFVPYDPSDPSAGVFDGPVRSHQNLTSAQLDLYGAALFNRNFAPLYKNFTGGSEWLGNFPTKPPTHHMWRADYLSQSHNITTRETHFLTLPPEELLPRLSQRDMRRNKLDGPVLMEYREPGTMNITITAVSVAPRIFQIDGFLSDVEVDHILDLAAKKDLQRSMTGIHDSTSSVSNVRTSRNTWLTRSSSPIMDAIIRRGADVLQIDEAMFRYRDPDERRTASYSSDPINEDLQVVHYDVGQEYTAHHDFDYPDSRPNAPSRSINLCLYLNDEGLVGGETAFPRARNAETTEGIKAIPKKGKAMIFYMKNPDGNLDDLSQHAAMPVIQGEKWFANMWTWDPIRT